MALLIQSANIQLYIYVLVLKELTCQTSEQFQAVTSAGQPQCSGDQPTLTQKARSKIECSSLCMLLQDGGCVTFNFKQNSLSCDLFASLASNYVELPGCTLYQLSSQFIKIEATSTRAAQGNTATADSANTTTATVKQVASSTGGVTEGTSLGTTVETTEGTTAGTAGRTTVGTTVGTTAGTSVETTVGTTVRTAVGTTVGTSLGTTEGTTVGTTVGIIAGTSVGTAMGTTVGTTLGTTEGTTEGTTVETTAGTSLETNEGTSLGTTEGTSARTSGETTEGTVAGTIVGSITGITEGSTGETTEGATSGTTTETTEGSSVSTTEGTTANQCIVKPIFANFTNPTTGCVVNMISRGLQDCDFTFGTPSTIAINQSAIVAENARGFYMANFHPASCSVANLAKFDTSTYSQNSINETIALVDYVSGTPNGTLVVGITWDDTTSTAFQTAYPLLLDTLGVDLSTLEFRGKVTFMTQVGYPEKAVMNLLPAGGPCLNLTVTVV